MFVSPTIKSGFAGKLHAAAWSAPAVDTAIVILTPHVGGD